VILPPEAYFPCLAPPEQGAVRVVYASFVPTYFVVPVQPVIDWYASNSFGFDDRITFFETMFRVIREEVEIFPGVDPVLCYIGFNAFYLSWLLYDPIALGTSPPPCRLYEYGQP